MATLYATEAQWLVDPNIYDAGTILVVVPEGYTQKSGSFSFRTANGKQRVGLLSLSGNVANFTIPDYVTVANFPPQITGYSLETTQKILQTLLEQFTFTGPNLNTTGGGGGGAVTIAEGADVAEGATTDATVAAGAQGTVSAKLRRLTTDLSAVLAKLSADPSTATLQGTGNTTLAAILAKIIAAPATEATLAAVLAALSSVPVTGPLTDAQLRATPVPVSGTVATGGLTDAQLRATAVPVTDAPVLAELVLILAKLSADPATQTTLAAVLAKLSSDPSTATLQSTINATIAAFEAANHTDLAALLTKLNASIAITAAALPLPAGAATSALQTQPGVDIGDVTVNNASGAGAVNVQDGGNSLTVDAPVGTPAFVRLSDGSAAITTLPVSAASLPLPTGASTAAKQPALGTAGTASADVLTVQGIASMTALKVDGSAITQPISGTVAVSGLSGTSRVNTTQLNSNTIDTDSGAKSSGTQRVVLATDQPQLTNALKVDGSAVTQPVSGTVALGAGSAVIGHVIVDTAPSTPVTNAGTFAAQNTQQGTASQNVAQLAGTTTDTNSGNKSAGTLRVILATDQPAMTNAQPVSVSSITPPTLTKGTQGSTGFSTQDLKDAGRTTIVLYATNAASGLTGIETAITLTQSSGTSANSSAVSFTPPSGKTWRIQQIFVASRGNGTATQQNSTFNLRMNTAGAVTTASTPILMALRTSTPATAVAYDRLIMPIPDGMEIYGDGTMQIGLTASAGFLVNAPTWDACIVIAQY